MSCARRGQEWLEITMQTNKQQKSDEENGETDRTSKDNQKQEENPIKNKKI